MTAIIRGNSATLVALIALVLALLPLPATAQTCGRQAKASASASVAGTPLVAAAQAPLAIVSGGGSAILTDDDGDTYPLHFGITSRIATDNSAAGHITFVFQGPFARDWGAVPGVDKIHLNGTVTGGSVAPDGTVTLTGTVTEVDWTHGEGIVFVVENDPFTIVVGGGMRPDEFSFQWCLLPTFQVQVTDGRLSVS